MKVTTDGCLFGAWVAGRIKNEKLIINNCLDIGTGTGLLSLLLAQKMDAPIDAIEIDKQAFEQATENAAAAPWNKRIKVFHADAKNFSGKHPYNLIISNPPFYENELKSGSNRKNVAHHSDDLEFKDLLITIKKNLHPDGIFCLLLLFKRNKEIKKLLTEHDFIVLQMTFVRPSVNHDYFRIMLIGKLKTGETTETMIDEISIKEGSLINPEQQYSPAFVNLLKDYYLHM